MTDTPATTPVPAAPTPIRKRGGPNRRVIEWARPDFGKTTLAMTLASDVNDPRWRWVALVDGDESASSVSHLFVDPAVARHFPVALDWREFVSILNALLPAVASGECGAVVVEGLCPLYDFLVGGSFADNPEDVEAGGPTTMRLYTAPSAKLRAVHTAITRLYQAAPRDSGFVMVITMHAKNVGGMGKPPVWEPDVSNGVWQEFWRMTPICVELDRFGDGAPRIVFEDPEHKIRRVKNAVARDKLRSLVASGKPEDLRKFSTLPAFLDLIRGAEQFAAKQQAARFGAAAPKPAPTPVPTPDATDLPVAA